ncbi:MAG: regulatory protein RecX [Myxococcota bacterium]
MPEKKSPIEAALKIISRRRLSSIEIEKKMKRAGYSEEEVHSAIEYLRNSNYLNDAELLSDYINYLIEKRLYGPERVIAYLRQKGFEPNLIRETMFRLYGDEQFIKSAERLISKKIKDSDLKEPEIKGKAIRILTYNGYNWEIIERVLNR